MLQVWIKSYKLQVIVVYQWQKTYLSTVGLSIG